MGMELLTIKYKQKWPFLHKMLMANLCQILTVFCWRFRKGNMYQNATSYASSILWLINQPPQPAPAQK